ncbi:MAG: carboxypeptidase-like regulatory domain-containing protein [Flavobacteriales bacterium]|nr:carboxypeptidase-like regulatory domain-containing protein [Flavobacteriales bacterium]
MKYLTVFFLGILVLQAFDAKSQLDSNYILIGTIVDGESNEVLIGAHIITSKHLGSKTNENGVFEISTILNDTLNISYVGYKNIIYVSPKKEKGRYLTKFKMYKDSISLTEVEILPWPTYDEFKEAFKALDLTEQEIKMTGIKMYTDRNIQPLDYKLYHAVTNPISFIYDRLLDKKAKNKRQLGRRRDSINKAALKE